MQIFNVTKNKRGIKNRHLFLTVCIMFILFSTSCTSLTKLGVDDYPNDNLTKKNYSELNGTYSNSHDTIFGKLEHAPFDGYNELELLEHQNILNQLFLIVPESSFRSEDKKIIDPKEKWIKIEFKSSRKAVVSMYHNDKFVFSKNIHGKYKNGYFYLRPKIFIFPGIPLAFGYSFERARLGKSGDNLLLDYSINMWVVAAISGSSDKGYCSSVYKKKE